MNFPDIFILLGVLLVTGMGVHLIQTYWPYMKRQQHGDVAGFILGVVGALYAVVLGFVVIVGWENLNSARTTTYEEADQLANIYWMSGSLPSPRGPAIQGLTVKYANFVIDTDWPLMGKGETSYKTQVILDQIRDDVFEFAPRSGQQQALYEQELASVNSLSGAHRDRLNSMGELIPEPLWVVLIVGGVLVIGFCMLFGVENKAAHIGMAAGYAALITISLFLIKDMQHPFAGNPHVGPEALEQFLISIRVPH
jgi:hypothetical protein